MEDKVLQKEAIALAKKWQNRANELTSAFDKKFYVKMNKMLAHPEDKALLIELMDQSFRSKNNVRVAEQILYLLEKYKYAHFFTIKDKILLWGFKRFALLMPNLCVPMFISYIRNDTKTVVIKGEKKYFSEFLQKRKAEKIKVNVNLIGEVILGEDEAEQRMNKYLDALKQKNITYISIKISTIFSQINTLDFDNTVKILSDKLTLLYRAAKKNTFIDDKGEKKYKFINLDMEEYRDLVLSIETFKKTLDKPEFKDLYAGIVLQTYLPDSSLWQKNLTTWAKKRVKNGGTPIKIRLVKGANMEMEETEASQKHWDLVTYSDKSDTDSNYKRMLRFGLDKKNAPFVHIGTASHNLFEQAFSVVLAEHNKTSQFHTVEMLEGMSDGARQAIKELSQDVILYAPTSKKEQFTNAIAYLVRRLDENTSEQNFIRHSFGLTVGSSSWNKQEKLFLKSFENEKTSYIGVVRKQDRQKEKFTRFKNSSFDTGTFQNEPDTDFTLEANIAWAQKILKDYEPNANTKYKTIGPVIAGKELSGSRETIDVFDKCQKKKIIVGKYRLASEIDIKKAIKAGKDDVDKWAKMSPINKHKIFKKVAINLRERRATLLAFAALEVSKTLTQSDVEVSEAIDFVEFYAHSLRYFENYKNLKMKPKGLGLIVSPWNFPLAIPLGGMAASLIAGNTTIIKPSSCAVLCAYELCKCFWDAGVSKNTLQFLPCSGSLAGKTLIPSEDVKFVVLTGGEDTAKAMLKTRASLHLSAETGGKDATIVTSLADKEQAIRNVCHSAFDNLGQKCSSTSLLILQKDVYLDKDFKNGLVDCAKSFSQGSVWNPQNTITCMSTKIGAKLKKAVSTLEAGETWALKPKILEKNPYMMTPSIKYGVKNGSFTHMNELFGPMLSVMRADSLEEAIELVNATGYGLTSGLESLDEREISLWKEHIKAGNLYVNRGTTGAIVLRQPFGGIGKSAIGAGRKVGHYNYITQFMDFKEVKEPTISSKKDYKNTELYKDFKILAGHFKEYKADFSKLDIALKSYFDAYESEFSIQKDYCKVRGEDNYFKYLKRQKLALRITKKDSVFNALARILAARVAQVKFTLSIEPKTKVEEILAKMPSILGSNIQKIQSEKDFISELSSYKQITYANISDISDNVFKICAQNLVYLSKMPVFSEGRLELLNYFQEQSISHSYHRYGNISARELQKS